jgi:hypothetical protein
MAGDQVDFPGWDAPTAQRVVDDLGMTLGDDDIEQHQVLEINGFLSKHPPDFRFESLVERYGVEMRDG